ncbi:MAG TPA: SCP2 sterol-binding domain-containing protein [Streptosporangiaceae bacterium]|nr:SCP2 sterol-binding domain-containing protein [Streptosporangiaceae bacterium]
MPSAEECREALEKLTARLSELDPQDRAAYFSGRSFTCHVPDLGVVFATRFGPDGAGPVREADPGDPPADVRLTAGSDAVIDLAANPAGLPRAWLAGRVRIQASMRYLLKLRKLL